MSKIEVNEIVERTSGSGVNITNNIIMEYITKVITY